MGRQHTIYLSDVTYSEMESLKHEGESMSQVIRNSIAICHANKDNFELVDYQHKTIEALKRKVAFLQREMCNRCKKDLII